MSLGKKEIETDLKIIMEPDTKQEETPKRLVSFYDIIQLPKRLRPTGPGGRGRGRRISGIPNPLVTSKESFNHVKESHGRTEKRDTAKRVKEEVCKKAMAQKAKRDRLVRKLQKDPDWNT